MRMVWWISAFLCISGVQAFVPLIPRQNDVLNTLNEMTNKIAKPRWRRRCSDVFALKATLSTYETFGDATLSDETFAELYGGDSTTNGLPEWLTTRCEECGWIYPTLVQQRSLNAVLDGDDVVIQSQTGSGKTLAYLLPLLANLDATRAAVQAIVIVPTRELGLQVSRVAKRLAAGYVPQEEAKKKILIMNLLQGSALKRQRAWAWAEPPQMVVGTPQEVTNMVRYGGIKHNAVRYVVVDEVDACLLSNAGSMTANLQSNVNMNDKGSPLHNLLSRHLSPTYTTPEKEMTTLESINHQLQVGAVSSSSFARPIAYRQTIFCSATIPQHRHFLKQCVQNQWTTREPRYVWASPGELLPPTLRHTNLVCTRHDQKLAALRRLLCKLPLGSKVLVFCEPQRPMIQMAQILAHDTHGIVWKEGYGQEHERQPKTQSIVSVLLYNDSLSQRASAMMGFQGPDKKKKTAEAKADETFTNDENQEKLRVLVSTDLAARGLDVADVTHVIQFDLAPDADTYVHRAGRTGRLGRQGTVVSIVTVDQEFVLQRLANQLQLSLHCLGRQRGKDKKKRKQ